MKTLFRCLLFFALASIANAQQVFRADVHIGQNWGTVRCNRDLKLLINGPVVSTYRYRLSGITQWTTIQGMASGVATKISTLTNSKNVPAGFNQSMSGYQLVMPPIGVLVEFDFNNNNLSDGSVQVYAPQCEMTLYYPGGTGSYFDFAVPAVTVTLNTGGEPTVSVQDPLPILGDTDGDGIADTNDPDDDNDGIPDGMDLFPLDPGESTDADGDGTGDVADTDDDNDGTNDVNDPFPKNPGEEVDADHDGWGSNTDPDDNDPSKPGGKGGTAGDGSENGGGTGPPGNGDGEGDRTGDDRRLNETSEGWSDVTLPGDGNKGQDTATKANNAGGKMGTKLFGFLPAQASPIPMATALPVNISLANGMSINRTIQLDAAPFPQIRTVFLVCFIALCGVAFLKKVTI
jgi:hypothetical protein